MLFKSLRYLTITTFILVLVTTNSALALTPYERAVELMNSINVSRTSYPLTNATTVCLDLTTDLSREDKGTKPEAVTKLQNFLYPKYLQEPATGYFGVLTEAAVKKFQAEYANEIATPTGYVGPLTRTIIKTLTCGGTQASTSGTKAGETTTSRNTSTANAYDPNGAWWLPPVLTPTTGPTGTGSTDPIKTTTITPTPTTTTTPPANCEQYAGVIPGDTRKVTQTLLGVPIRNFLVTLSSEALLQYKRNIAGRFGDFTNVFVTGKTAEHGTRPRLTLRSGEVLVVPFRTAAEYTYMPRIEYFTLETPNTPEGVVSMSISPCPADFTSPFFAGTPDWKRDVAIPGNGPGKNCIATAPATTASFEVTVGNPGGYSCDLEPNKTYYFNITAGFSDTDGRKEGTMFPHIGKIAVGGSLTTDGVMVTKNEMIIDEIAMDRSGRPGTPLSLIPKTIKGQDLFYDEVRKEQEKISERLRNRTNRGPNYVNEWITGSIQQF